MFQRLCCIAFTSILHNISSLSLAQETRKLPIEVMKQKQGYTFVYKEKTLKRKELESILKKEKKTHYELEEAVKFRELSFICGASGSILVSFPIGAALRGDEDPAWNLGVLGVGLSVFAMIFESKLNQHYIKAIDIYNGQLHSISGNYFEQKKYSYGVNKISISFTF